MIYHKYIPGFPLNGYVEGIVYIEGNNKGAGLPKAAMSMVFNLGDGFKLYADNGFSHFSNYQKYWVAGLQLRPSYVESYGSSRMVVVQFTTIGARVFLNQPLHYFTDQYVELDGVFGGEAKELWEKLQEAPSLPEKFLTTERFLYRKLLTAELLDNKLLSTVNSLLQRTPAASIATVCGQTGISRKHLNHLCKDYVGVSPKTLWSIHRLQKALERLSQTQPEKLTDTALELEYFDQAHFTNDFKRFTGLSPSAYLKLVRMRNSLKTVPHFLPAS